MRVEGRRLEEEERRKTEKQNGDDRRSLAQRRLRGLPHEREGQRAFHGRHDPGHPRTHSEREERGGARRVLAPDQAVHDDVVDTKELGVRERCRVQEPTGKDLGLQQVRILVARERKRVKRSLGEDRVRNSEGADQPEDERSREATHPAAIKPSLPGGAPCPAATASNSAW